MCSSNDDAFGGNLDLWSELYDISWQFYVKDVWDSSRFKAVVSEIKNGGDKHLIHFLIWFNDSRKSVDYNTRFEWLTSSLFGRNYPPLDCIVRVRPQNNRKQLTSMNFRNEKINDFVKLSSVLDTSAMITQHSSINDCSLVCSLINARKRGLIKSFEADGYLNLNFYFNGAKRLIALPLDSLLPIDSGSGLPIALSSSNMHDKLIEVAYLELKNNHSYEFGGSNSAADTYLLTGWLPEVIETGRLSLQTFTNYWKSGAMMALGTGAMTEDVKINFHDFVVDSVEFETEKVSVSDPHLPNSPVIHTWKNLQKSFSWVYINWNPEIKYQYHSRFYDRYSERANKYRTWTQKPLISIANETSTEQKCYIFAEKHLLETCRSTSNITLGCIPKAGFTTADANGNNMGLCGQDITLQPNETKTLVYHSDVKCNFTFHLFSNSNAIKMLRGRSDVFTVESNWNTTNNQWPIDSICYFRSPTFRLKIFGTDETYLDFELVSEISAIVNFQIFEANDYTLEHPIFKYLEYHTQICSAHGVRLLSGVEYNIVCSLRYPVISEFILALRKASSDIRFELVPITAGFGGLRYQKTIIMKHKIYFSLISFTELFLLMYSPTHISDDPVTLKLLDMESCQPAINVSLPLPSLAKKPFVISDLQLQPGKYVMQVENLTSSIVLNMGSSHKIEISEKEQL